MKLSDLFGRRPSTLEAADYVVLEYHPTDPTKYRLVRYQSQPGDLKETRTVLTPSDWSQQ